MKFITPEAYINDTDSFGDLAKQLDIACQLLYFLEHKQIENGSVGQHKHCCCLILSWFTYRSYG